VSIHTHCAVVCVTEAVGSVFNHYTRVRANLAAFDDESGADPWSEAEADDGMCHFYFSFTRGDVNELSTLWRVVCTLTSSPPACSTASSTTSTSKTSLVIREEQCTGHVCRKIHMKIRPAQKFHLLQRTNRIREDITRAYPCTRS
jgi:hypothetical protein